MTDEEMKRLEELAKGATPGPWCVDDVIDQHIITASTGRVAQTAVLGDWDNATPLQEADGRFIAAADPTAVLALIERVRKAERNGAEEMRKAVVIRLRETSLGLDIVGRMAEDYDIKHHLYDRSTGYDEAAEDVALLPIPGDAP